MGNAVECARKLNVQRPVICRLQILTVGFLSHLDIPDGVASSDTSALPCESQVLDDAVENSHKPGAYWGGGKLHGGGSAFPIGD